VKGFAGPRGGPPGRLLLAEFVKLLGNGVHTGFDSFTRRLAFYGQNFCQGIGNRRSGDPTESDIHREMLPQLIDFRPYLVKFCGHRYVGSLLLDKEFPLFAQLLLS